MHSSGFRLGSHSLSVDQFLYRRTTSPDKAFCITKQCGLTMLCSSTCSDVIHALTSNCSSIKKTVGVGVYALFTACIISNKNKRAELHAVWLREILHLQTMNGWYLLHTCHPLKFYVYLQLVTADKVLDIGEGPFN